MSLLVVVMAHVVPPQVLCSQALFWATAAACCYVLQSGCLLAAANALLKGGQPMQEADLLNFGLFLLVC